MITFIGMEIPNQCSDHSDYYHNTMRARCQGAALSPNHLSLWSLTFLVLKIMFECVLGFVVPISLGKGVITLKEKYDPHNRKITVGLFKEPY